LADPLAQRGAPFYICQLAALKGSGELPEKRAGQEMILKLPDTGMALTIDVGDPANVHPKNKQAIGDLLCRIELAEAYGQNIEFFGPVVESMEIEGGIVRLTFTHAEGGLIARGSDAGEVKTFQVAGSDGKLVPATAKLTGMGSWCPVRRSVRRQGFAMRGSHNPNDVTCTTRPAFPPHHSR
jgi:sialate O-acetylesterase